jgi:hypothetical protein
MKTLKLFTQIALIMIAIALSVHFVKQLARVPEVRDNLYQESLHIAHYYPEVAYMLADDSIMDIHRFWGIDTIDYTDWENTATNLGVPTEIMTIDMYMDYLQDTSSNEYARQRMRQ